MGKQGKYVLSYASFYQNKIKDICAIPEASAIIEDILFKQISELDDFINGPDRSAAEIRSFAQRIISQFGHLSISAVAHWVHLIQASTPPFDLQLYGFDKRQVLGSLYKYLEQQKTWIDEKEKQESDSIGLAERARLTAVAINSNEDIKNRFKELRLKLEAKHKDLSIYQTRSYNRRFESH